MRNSFNPCFNGSVERGGCLPTVSMRLCRVSILVLMEVLREVFPSRAELCPCPVSILVLMEVLREEKPPGSSIQGAFVSILVLMEVLREAVWPRQAKARAASFNPCFNGSVERGRGR